MFTHGYYMKWLLVSIYFDVGVFTKKQWMPFADQNIKFESGWI